MRDIFGMANITTIYIFLCATFMTITTIFLFYNHENIFNRPNCVPIQTKEETFKNCNLFEGEWIQDLTAPVYTNYSCKTIPLNKNCLLNGRKNTDFLHWRWKPSQCELPRFDPQTFLSILRGKKMAFIGDSLARNQMESLLCLLSEGETPRLIKKDAENRFTTWEFPNHDFTLTALWSKFLVLATQIVVNGTDTGSFDLHLDRVDPSWPEKLSSFDYVVFSTGQWFIRPNRLYNNNTLIGCTFCTMSNGTFIEPKFAIEKAIGTTFKAINECKNCEKVVSFLTTFSPRHFDNGDWNTGGGCNQTEPIKREEVDRDRTDRELSIRAIEMVEVEMTRNRGNNIFEVIDVTEMMSVRVDGHPDWYWMKEKKDYRDCVHWCLPGPIDTWNELMLEMIKREKK